MIEIERLQVIDYYDYLHVHDYLLTIESNQLFEMFGICMNSDQTVYYLCD